MAQPSLFPNQDKSIDFPPPGAPVDTYFPVHRAPPASDTFEIGLVLGGTVSAAAYTAGVVDFLVQALDAWTVGKTAGTMPHHKVAIKIASGTSGGAIMCTLLARLLGNAFPHAGFDTPEAQRADAPFYDCWVNQIDISDLLQLSDLSSNRISSLLCATKIDVVGQKIADYAGPPLGGNGTPPARDYVEQYLPVVLTLTNLRGIPYSSDFRGTSARPEYFTNHADHARFLVDISGVRPPATAQIQPYEIAISKAAAASVQPWPVMINAARGSSAFPVGLPPKVIARDPQQYRYRYAIIDNQPQWLRPAWPWMIPIGSGPTDPYQFLAVDGGCFNNEPICYAADWLEGIQGPREDAGDKAHRAILLVDPFADTPDPGPMADGGILKSAGATLTAFTSGTRYETAVMDLFTAEDVFSRYLVNPVRQPDPVNDPKRVLTGADAIATNTLMAFGGFLSKSYRMHDYMLGRRNCQQFLRANFVLDQNNSLFAAWTPQQRAKFGAGLGGYLPIIPLTDAMAKESLQPAWPKGTFQPATIKDALAQRLTRIGTLATGAFIGKQPLLNRWVLNMVVSAAEKDGTSALIDAITAQLQQSDLL
jgi:hypothetical protein